MSRELTHFIQQFSNDLYMELQDLAMQHLRQQLGEDGLEQLILDTVKKNGFTGDNARAKAMEELTAQFCEKMFSI